MPLGTFSMTMNLGIEHTELVDCVARGKKTPG